MGASFILAFLFVHTVFLSLSITGTHSAIFTFKNNCPYTVWPGILTPSGPPLASTGFELAPNASSPLNVPVGWSGRFWARTQCTSNNGQFTCATGDCGTGQVACKGAGGVPPATLADFTVSGRGGNDFFEISLVNGFNLPLSIKPRDGPVMCTSTSCSADINKICPKSLAVRDNHGVIIACKSACLAFREEQYCCTGSHSSAETCRSTSYAKMFKRHCPQAYTYVFDKKMTTSTCASGGDYVITFCP